MIRNTIGEQMQRVNPIPDPEDVFSDRETDSLFASIGQRREAMVLTDQKLTTQRTPGLRPRYRKRAVIVVAALVVLIAVPAVAVFIDWDRPPLGSEFPEGTAALTVYDADDGVGEYCAAHIGIDPDGVPVLGGMCGVLRLDGNEFSVVTSEVDSYVDMAVAPDGTVWLADVDGPVRSVADGRVTTHALVARQIEVTADGSVFAIRYGPLETDVPVLMQLRDGAFVEVAPGPIDDIAAAPDGSLRTIGLYDFSSQGGEVTPAVHHIGRMTAGVHTTEPVPEGFAGDHLTVASDGSLWLIGDTGRVIDRGGLDDVEWALIRYDGTEVSFLILPFPEPTDFAFHPDGTVWATSSLYGAFAYDGEEWVRYGVEEGLPDEAAYAIEIAPDGSVYVGTDLGLARIVPES